MHHLTPLTLLTAFALACSPTASSDKPLANAAAAGPTAKPKDAPTKPSPEEAKAPVVSHFELAMADVGAGKSPATADPKPYGCSVKYADGAKPAAAPKLGETAPDFELADLDGKKYKLSEFVGKTVVLEWFNPECPFVKYAYGEGPLQSMAAKYTKEDVVWLSINSGAEGKQGAGLKLNQRYAKEYGMGQPILLDMSGEVGLRYGAKTTPHMYIVNKDGVLVYGGGLDNAPFGKVES